MVAIADSVPKPASRFRFILDRRDVLGAIFVAPAILYVLLLVGMPLLLSIYYSVSAYTIYNPSWRFVGLANFGTLLTDSIWSKPFWNAFLNNVILFCVHMLVQNPIGIALAGPRDRECGRLAAGRIDDDRRAIGG